MLVGTTGPNYKYSFVRAAFVNFSQPRLHDLLELSRFGRMPYCRFLVIIPLYAFWYCYSVALFLIAFLPSIAYLLLSCIFHLSHIFLCHTYSSVAHLLLSQLSKFPLEPLLSLTPSSLYVFSTSNFPSFPSFSLPSFFHCLYHVSFLFLCLISSHTEASLEVNCTFLSLVPTWPQHSHVDCPKPLKSIPLLVSVLLWKSSNIFATFSPSSHTSSFVFCNCSIRSELTCSGVTFSIDAVASCNFCCIGWMMPITISTHNSSTFSARCCCCVRITITCCCNFLISVSLSIFRAKENCFISSFSEFTSISIVPISSTTLSNSASSRRDT